MRHPRPVLLLRFLRGEAAPAESRAVVRHLLTGCPKCTAVTRPIWLLADGVLPAVDSMAGRNHGPLL